MPKCQKRYCSVAEGTPMTELALFGVMTMIVCPSHLRAFNLDEGMLKLSDWSSDLDSNQDVLLAMCRGGVISLELAEKNRQVILDESAKHRRAVMRQVYAWLDTPDAK